MTSRDYQLFKFLFRGRIATIEQINRYIFGGIRLQTVGRRLNRLSEKRYVVKTPFVMDCKAKLAYQVSDKGLSEIQSQLKYQVKGRPRKSDSPEHDVTLNDIRYVFDKAEKALQVLSENELQSCEEFSGSQGLRPFVDLNSDGAIQFKKDDEHFYVALEYDASEKSHHRYVEKIGSYYRHSSIPAVLYICKSNHIRKVLKKAETEVLKGQDKKPKFYYATLSDVLEGSDQMSFENLSGRIFKL